MQHIYTYYLVYTYKTICNNILLSSLHSESIVIFVVCKSWVGVSLRLVMTALSNEAEVILS